MRASGASLGTLIAADTVPRGRPEAALAPVGSSKHFNFRDHLQAPLPFLSQDVAIEGGSTYDFDFLLHSIDLAPKSPQGPRGAATHAR